MSNRCFLKILERLNEAQSRWYVAREAIALGRGGIQRMHELTGISRPTITKGIRELRSGRLCKGDRVRRAGGGRKRLETGDPSLTEALKRIMDENTAGDPVSPLRWTNKSTGTIAEELTRRGHAVSANTVGRRLHEMGYSLQANKKTRDGVSHANRDAQFRYINEQVRRFHVRGAPVLSVDAKKKEQVGRFKNAGRTWRAKGHPEEVNMHDFPSLGEGPAFPYGAFDEQHNTGFVNVGISSDTAEFAVESLRRWWKIVGRRYYPDARTLLICADSGGSNGSRNRGWKYFLQQFANEWGLSVTVCHYPPGTSKWNKIEHRMFSFISMNWAGQPLTSYQTIVNLIGGTRTRTGLRIRATLDSHEYQKGLKFTQKEMASLNIRMHDTHPEWNYTIDTCDN